MQIPASDLGLRGSQVSHGENILVLGTGEFVWEPFLLAERLEAAVTQVEDVQFDDPLTDFHWLYYPVRHCFQR